MRTAILVAALLLPGCAYFGAPGAPKTVAAFEQPAGQLFCAIETNGGGQIVVGVIDAAATAYAGAAGPVIVATTGATAAAVQQNCALAAAAVGAKAGVPVSPPGFAVPNVAVQPVKT